MTRELVAVMAEFPNRICPHLHICLQSGSDRILRKMKRRWGAKRFIDRCHLVQETLHKPALTTDIIVGFPGESEADFEASCDVAREVGFSKIHIFPFSARRGTPAAEFPEQLSKQEKAARVDRLEVVEAEQRRRYFDSLVGEELQLMIESTADGFHRGTACRYAPMQIPARGLAEGELARASIGSQTVDGILA